MGEEVGQEHDVGGLRPVRAPLLGDQLVEGGEREGLQPVAREQFGGGDAGVHVVDDAFGAAVAVGDGLGQELPVGVEEAVVHAPGVDADRRQVGVGGGQRLEPGLDLGDEAGEVPTEVAVALDHAVREPVHDVEGEVVAVDEAGHHPSAGGAEVDGTEDPRRH